MVAVGAFAQNKSLGINLSVWKNLSTQRNDSTQTSYLNIGLLSSMNQLNGFGLNVLGGIVNKNANGVMLSGIANIVGESMRGIQFGGICNVNGDEMVGASLSGLVNIVGNNTKGLLITGLSNITGDNSSAVMIGGIMNISGDNVNGMHLSGVANIAGDNLNGAMISGLLNIAGETLNGVQVSALANIVGTQMNGVQVGLANFATRAKGIQLGLINYYRENLDGFQLGLINANPNTKVQMMLYGGNNAKMNLAVRFKNDFYYTMLGTSAYYFDFKDRYSASFFYRAGIWHTLYKNLSLSGDLGFQHIEGFKSKDLGFPARLYSLQARLNLEYQFTDKVGVFATGGYAIDRRYKKSSTYDKGAIIEAGIILF